MPKSHVRAESNRRNSQRSTGPKTPQGKARASRNSFKHGLNLPNPQLDPAARQLALALVGLNAGETIQALAEEAALAALEAIRVNAYRTGALQSAMTNSDTGTEPVDSVCSNIGQLALLERYLVRARARRTNALRRLEEAMRRKKASV